MNNKKTFIALVLCLSIIAISGLAIHQKIENNRTKLRISKIYVPSEKEFVEQITPEKVNEYESSVNIAFKEMLKGNIVVGKYATADGEKFMKSLFVITGTEPITDDSSVATRKKYYSNFDYKITNFAIRATKENLKSSEAVMDIEVISREKMVFKTFITVYLDSSLKISGGDFYGSI